MTVATDTFAEFVDQLAEALDDHDATGEDWPRGCTSRASTSTG